MGKNKNKKRNRNSVISQGPSEAANESSSPTAQTNDERKQDIEAGAEDIKFNISPQAKITNALIQEDLKKEKQKIDVSPEKLQKFDSENNSTTEDKPSKLQSMVQNANKMNTSIDQSDQDQVLADQIKKQTDEENPFDDYNDKPKPKDSKIHKPKSLSVDIDDGGKKDTGYTPSNGALNPQMSDDRYLDKANEDADAQKVTNPIEYKQASDYIDSQRLNDQENGGIEKMISQVQIDDGKDDLEATFGKDGNSKYSMNGYKKASKVSKRFMPPARQNRNFADSMFSNSSVSNPYVSKSFMDRNTNIKSIRDQEGAKNKSRLGSYRDIDYNFDRNAKLGSISPVRQIKPLKRDQAPGPGYYNPSKADRFVRSSIPSHVIPKKKYASRKNMNTTPDPTSYNTFKQFGSEAINVTIGNNDSSQKLQYNVERSQLFDKDRVMQTEGNDQNDERQYHQSSRHNRSRMSRTNQTQSPNISARKFKVRNNGATPSYMSPTKSSTLKQTGVFMEIDNATSYIQSEMHRIHSSSMSNYEQLMALEKLENINKRLVNRNQSILQESFSYNYNDPELINYKASQRFKGSIKIENDGDLMSIAQSTQSFSRKNMSTLQSRPEMNESDRFMNRQPLKLNTDAKKKKKNWGLPKKRNLGESLPSQQFKTLDYSQNLRSSVAFPKPSQQSLVPKYKPLKLNKDMYKLSSTSALGLGRRKQDFQMPRYSKDNYGQSYKSAYSYGKKKKKKKVAKTDEDLEVRGGGAFEVIGDLAQGLIA